ncbi:MAG: hypothetical protein JXN61_04980 [Sedimentisphaerales bacterium]|nr:hypothetical protein [Sedimentisphaerales bacterium]
MTLSARGRNISAAEVSHINGRGLWLCVQELTWRSIRWSILRIILWCMNEAAGAAKIAATRWYFA